MMDDQGGSRAFSITCYDPMRAMMKNGSMFGKTLFEPG